MSSLINDLHQKGQADNFLRQALVNQESITVYIPGDFAIESARGLLLMLVENIEKQTGSKVRLDCEFKVGNAPGNSGELNEDKRLIVQFSGYSRF